MFMFFPWSLLTHARRNTSFLLFLRDIMFTYQTGWHNAQMEKDTEKREFHVTAATLQASSDRHVKRSECDSLGSHQVHINQQKVRAEIGGIMENGHTHRLDKIYLSKTRVRAIQKVLLEKLFQVALIVVIFHVRGTTALFH